MLISFAFIASTFSKAEAQRRRRDIFVENQPRRNSSPVRGDIFGGEDPAPDGAGWGIHPLNYNYFAPDGAGKSFLAGFENIFRVVFYAEFFQQPNVFLAE